MQNFGIVGWILCLSMVLQPLSAQEITGRWYAKTTLGGEEKHYLFDARAQGEDYIGFLDLPATGQFRIPFDSISRSTDGQVYLEQRGLNFRFVGTVNNLKETILGTVQQDSLMSPLVFFREPQVKRTQVIKTPLPYEEREVYFFNNDSTRLAGTLTIPRQGKKDKAVVLITGSGPQDRNEEILGHRPFQVLADYLTRQGIAVLRYDDRGFGASEGRFRPATSRDYADDVLAAVHCLQQQEDLALEHIGLAGHSEGGNIAPVVASLDTSVNFLVLLAAPGTSNLESYLVSLDLILQDYPETYDRDYALFESVYRYMATIEDKEILRDSLTAAFSSVALLMSQAELADYGGAEQYVQGQVGYHTSDWYHHYLQFDVTPYLSALDMPVLALNGDQDISVEADFNLAGIETALRKAGNAHFEVVKLHNVNHFFQTSVDASIDSVYFNEETFNGEALRKIGEWIGKL